VKGIRIKNKIIDLINGSVDDLRKSGKIEWEGSLEIELEQPKDKAHGDWSTNSALIIASKLKKNPREIAEIIAGDLSESELFKKIEIAGPGFINFWLSESSLYDSLKEICVKKERYGHVADEKTGKIQVEFVSANPVGPMHVGHGRWAAVGDSLVRLLRAAGYNVESEFYINDFGNQMKIFGHSVAARYQEGLGREIEFPDEGYQGHYVKEIAKEIIDKDGDRFLDMSIEEQAEIFLERAYHQVLDHLKSILNGMDVHFDKWFSERELHNSGYMEKTFEQLKETGHTYEDEGALWLKTTEYGDDKDRVLVRANGEPTYFGADVAYHRDKIERGFTKIIDIWGADHHGYVGRMKAAISALGDRSSLEIIIGQLVNLYSGGRQIRMSKRTGEMVTLEELLNEVGKDPVRYFFLMRSTDTPLDFDIELAKSETSENPVYYVQYAHARICSIIKNAEKNHLFVVGERAQFHLLKEEPEISLMIVLANWPMVLAKAAEKRRPYRLTKYAEELASNFHHFYHECRVINDDKGLSEARLTLIDCTRIVLANVLYLIGVSSPETM